MADETRVEHGSYGCETGCCGYRAERADGTTDFYFDHPDTLSELARICREKDEPIVFGDVHCGEFGETPKDDLPEDGPDRVEKPEQCGQCGAEIQGGHGYCSEFVDSEDT